MIKKLRRRFIIVNMSILTCVLFSVLAGIFAYMYSSEVKISYELMESILMEKDVDFKEPVKIESAQALTFADKQKVSLMSLQNLAYDYEDYPEYYYEEYYEDYPDDYWDGGKRPFPGEQDFPPEPPPQEPTRPFWDNPPVPPDESSIPDSEPDDDSNDSEPDDDDDSHSSVPDDKDSSVNSRPDNPANQNTLPPENNSKPESSQGDESSDSTKPQTEKPAQTTAPDASENTEEKKTTVTSITTEHPPMPRDPYRGNVKRAYVMVQFNKEDDIDRIVYQYFDDADEDEIKAAAKTIIQGKSDKGKLTIGDYKLRYMKKDNPRMINGGSRLLFLDRTLEISTINRMLFIFIIIGSVGVVIIFGISVLLANWAIKPVDKAWQQQKQFVADASHELKTPLTVISANTDVILSNADDTVESQSKWLNYIKEETKRMTKLVNSMLYIAKYDSNELKFAATQFDLSDILSSICLQYEALVFEKGKQLETEIEDKIFIKGDEDKIKQLINILLDNAQKYSTDNGKIKAMLSRNQKTGKIRLAVANTSDYIAPDKLEKIFDRFYRLDDSRNRKTGGSGLGLNIAKSIVEAHGGEIKATHENGVTCFMVTL